MKTEAEEQCKSSHFLGVAVWLELMNTCQQSGDSSTASLLKASLLLLEVILGSLK